jgi:hypothetical protein
VRFCLKKRKSKASREGEGRTKKRGEERGGDGKGGELRRGEERREEDICQEVKLVKTLGEQLCSTFVGGRDVRT